MALQAGQAAWTPKVNPWIIALVVTLATFMEVLDTSIANVALPHIAGSLGAGQDESNWVLTSYLVANAIILPISAWLARLFGRKNFYMGCVVIFTLSSALCGLAPSLPLLILFRVLQGAGGGGLAPSEQAILADTFPPSMRGLAFSIYGMAVVVAPAIGPTLGGWITDNYSWHWVFYINVPVGLISLFLTNKLVEDPEYLIEERRKAKGRKVDVPGLSLIALGMGCLQVVLDKGQELDWFGSSVITIFMAVAVVTLVYWFRWEWKHPDPIVDVRMFKNRNFAIAMLFTFCLGMVLYGTTNVIPQYLQTLMGYSAVKAGEALAGGGLVMMVMMPVSGILVGRIDPRFLMAIGFSATAGALYFMSTHLSLQMDFTTAAMLRTLQSFGLPFIFIPSNTLAYVGIPREKSGQVSSMNAFIRNVGGSIGIAMINTLITRQAQKHQNYLAAHTANGSGPFEAMLNGFRQSLVHAGVGLAQAQQQAQARTYRVLQGQASVLGYVDVIGWLAILIVCLVPLVLLLRRNRPQAGQAPALH